MLAILALIVGGAALVVALTEKAGAAPPGTYVPSAEKIYASKDLFTLNSYYRKINDLFISGYISSDTYNDLYSVYEARFYELVGET